MVILILEAFVIYIPLYVLWCDSICTISSNYVRNIASSNRIKFSPENIFLRSAETLWVANNKKFMRLNMLTQDQIPDFYNFAKKLFTSETLAHFDKVQQEYAKNNSMDSIKAAYYKIYEVCMGYKSGITIVALAQVLVSIVLAASQPVTKMEDLDDKGRPN
jgi:hypothetical protein